MKKLVVLAKDVSQLLNFRQSFLNGLLTLIFRFVSLIMIPITLSITSSDEYVSMATSAIIFQLASTIFIGSIQIRIYDSSQIIGFRDLTKTFAINFIICIIMLIIAILSLKNVTWLNQYLINFCIIEAFCYAIFSGLLVSMKLKSGNFTSIRKLQSLEFALIGPLRLIILFMTHSVLIWATLGVLIRIGQVVLTWVYISDVKKSYGQTNFVSSNPEKQAINYDYSIINITFWALLNSAPLICLKIAPSTYIESLQVSIAIAGILGTFLTQISTALIPINLKRPHDSKIRRIFMTYSFLVFSTAIFGAPIAVFAVSLILDNPSVDSLQMTLIYISINLLFGFISLFQTFSYGSKSRTRHLRNGCIGALIVTLFADIFTFSRGVYDNLPLLSLVGFLFLTLYLYARNNFEFEPKSS